MLETIDDERLRVYVVWEPMLPGDSQKVAKGAMRLLPDSRVTHFWIGNQTIAKAFKKALGFKERMAWDVYIAYSAKTIWGDDLPIHSTFMHQLRGVPPENFLDGNDLAKQMQELLSQVDETR